MIDSALQSASNQVANAQKGVPQIAAFFDPDTFTVTYVVHDPETLRAAVIDSVLDYDPASGRTSTASAQKVIAHVEASGLTVDWHLETHAHADHLSAAPWLQQQLGGRIAIGEHIVTVQETFGKLFNAGTEFQRDGSDFDQLWKDGDHFAIGKLDVTVLHVPGHTPACVAYVIGDAVFVGDTMFMPDYGTARADFPGGDSRTLYRSARRLLALPPSTRLFMCHDYLPAGRTDHVWETTVAEQRKANIHIHDGVAEEAFVAMRDARDASLAMPRLILPSVQVNMRAGHMPPAEENGVTYLKIPVNAV
ncbi:MAG TPA: MBL fold metallo-hydrolase [Novosphingobium sp.]|mgnify:CR=1 FL=1|nr:MBL fold metallo-hydrolase [Novosphingobium sp.]HMP55978.1 MBL fold metallo-hydrolase [Novosphingobium sp.]